MSYNVPSLNFIFYASEFKGKWTKDRKLIQRFSEEVIHGDVNMYTLGYNFEFLSNTVILAC